MFSCSHDSPFQYSRAAVSGAQCAVCKARVEFPDTIGNGTDSILVRRVEIATMDPDDVGETRVAATEISTVLAQRIRRVCEHCLVPTLGAAVISDVGGREQDQDAVLGSLPKNPVGVGKVRFIWRAEIASPEKGRLAINVGWRFVENMCSKRLTRIVLKPRARRSCRYLSASSRVSWAINDQAVSPWMRKGCPQHPQGSVCQSDASGKSVSAMQYRRAAQQSENRPIAIAERDCHPSKRRRDASLLAYSVCVNLACVLPSATPPAQRVRSRHLFWLVKRL